MIFTKAQVAGLAAALSMCATPALATNCNNGGKWPECKPPTTTTPPATTISGTFTANSSSSANAAAGAQASGVGIGYGGSATAMTGPASSSIGDVSGGSASGSAAVTDSSRYGMYVFPAPVSAAPLPANLCPKGDSLSWSVGWNFFSWASSSTRTELECLEKVLAVVRAQPVVHEPRLYPRAGENLHPVCTVEKRKPRAGAKPKKTCK